MAAPSKFDTAAPIIIEALSKGLTRTLASKMARITYSTFCVWMNEGEADLKNNLDTPKSQFFDNVNETEAKLIAQWIEDISKGDRQDKKWLISRLAKEDYGDSSSLNVKGDMKVEHTITWQDLIKNVQESDKLD